MITKEDDTPQILVANSPSLQAHTVRKFVMEEMVTSERSRLSMRRVMARLPQELQRMSLADRSALLSNKEALKTFLEQISRPLDPTLTMHRDEHIPWLDEPLWKREYQERTGRHMVTNTATNERITVDMFCQRHKNRNCIF